MSIVSLRQAPIVLQQIRTNNSIVTCYQVAISFEYCSNCDLIISAVPCGTGVSAVEANTIV